MSNVCVSDQTEKDKAYISVQVHGLAKTGSVLKMNLTFPCTSKPQRCSVPFKVFNIKKKKKKLKIITIII